MALPIFDGLAVWKLGAVSPICVTGGFLSSETYSSNTVRFVTVAAFMHASTEVSGVDLQSRVMGCSVCISLYSKGVPSYPAEDYDGENDKWQDEGRQLNLAPPLNRPAHTLSVVSVIKI